MSDQYESLNTEMLNRLYTCNSQLNEFEKSLDKMTNIDGDGPGNTIRVFICAMMRSEIDVNDKLIKKVEEKRNLPF